MKKNNKKYNSSDWIRLKAEQEKRTEQNLISNSKTIQEKTMRKARNQQLYQRKNRIKKTFRVYIFRNSKLFV